MSKRNKHHTHQLNCKMTIGEFEKIQNVNQQLFGGQLNNSDLARFLMKFAMDKLSKAKVETKTITTIDGVEVK